MNEPNEMARRATRMQLAFATTRKRFLGESGSLLQESGTLDKDKIFAIYAFSLIGSLALLITCAVSLGVASLPNVEFIVEHAGLAVMFRASYKSFDGSNWIRDALERNGMITAPGTPPMGAAHAMS